MAILLKNVGELRELRELGDLYEFNPEKKYLLVISNPLPPPRIEVLSRVLESAGIYNMAILVGLSANGVKVFEMEHQA